MMEMEQKLMCYLAEQIRGVSYKPDDLHKQLDENSVILLRANNIDDGQINFDDVVYVDRSKVSCSQFLRKGDILVCASSGSRNLVGKAAQIDFEGKYTFGAFCKVVRPKEIDAEYLGMYFLSPTYRSIIASLAQGANINNIKNEHIDSLIVNIGNENECQQIVNILSRLLKVIHLRQQEIKELDDLIKARFVEMFGDMVTNYNGWENVLLGEVCDVRDGTHDSPQYYPEGYPLVTSKNVTGGKIDFTDCSLICEEDYNKINQRSKVDYGDILMPMIGTVGNPVIVDMDEKFAIKNVSLIKFRDNSVVINVFVKALLESDYFDRAVIGKVRGGTQKFISLGDIRKLEIYLPPISMQNQFADFVHQVDKSKVAIQKSLDEAQLLFDSLMQKYFG